METEPTMVERPGINPLLPMWVVLILLAALPLTRAEAAGAVLLWCLLPMSVLAVRHRVTGALSLLEMLVLAFVLAVGIFRAMGLHVAALGL